MELYAKITKIKKEIGKINKDKRNNFANFSYTELGTLFEKINKILSENQVLVDIQDIKPNIEMTRIMNSAYFDFVILVVNEEKTDEKLIKTFCFPADTEGKKMKLIQAAGSMITYASRYIYGALFSIQFEKDPDSDKSEQGESPYKKTDEPEKSWLNKNTKEFDNAVEDLKKGKTIKDIRNQYKVSKPTEKLLNDAKESKQTKVLWLSEKLFNTIKAGLMSGDKDLIATAVKNFDYFNTSTHKMKANQMEELLNIINNLKDEKNQKNTIRY